MNKYVPVCECHNVRVKKQGQIYREWGKMWIYVKKSELFTSFMSFYHICVFLPKVESDSWLWEMPASLGDWTIDLNYGEC